MSIFAEKLIDMHYNYGKTKVAFVKDATWAFERELQKRIDEIEKENGYVVDIKMAYHDIYCVGLIIYKCTAENEQDKEQ